jgi:hypothetical protein
MHTFGPAVSMQGRRYYWTAIDGDTPSCMAEQVGANAYHVRMDS